MEISPAERIRSLLDYTGTVVFKCTVCHKSPTFALDYWRSEQDVWEPPFGRTAILAHYAWALALAFERAKTLAKGSQQFNLYFIRRLHFN